MAKILQKGEEGYGILFERDAGYIGVDINSQYLTEGIKLVPNEPLLINCILQKWGVKNKNGRIYPKSVLVPQAELYQEQIKANAAVSEADHPDCVCASESMICTKEGWKNFEDISEDEEILTLNTQTNQIEIQKIIKRVYEPYKGKMYKINGNDIEITVTPNHRFLLLTPNNEYVYVSAHDLVNNKEIYFSNNYKIQKIYNLDLFNSLSTINDYIVLNNEITISEIDFDDYIACVTVPNQNFYVMVNGKSHWTGNSSIISLNNISHMITKMWWGNGEFENVLYGQLKILVTRGYINYGVVSVIGDKIAFYLENKIKIGISSRGVGSLKTINGENLVQSDFELIGFDLVSSPSTPGAYLFPDDTSMGMKEEYVEKNGILIKEDNNKILSATQKFLL